MVFTEDEMLLMMIHNPGSRLGLKEVLIKMRKILEENEWNLKQLTDGVLRHCEKFSTTISFGRSTWQPVRELSITLPKLYNDVVFGVS